MVTMPTEITVDELFRLMRFESKGRFFSVVTERRTRSLRNRQQQGDLRKMLCRTGMVSHKKGIIPDEARDREDFQHGILTVWSMDAYMENRRRGQGHEDAAYYAWRRVDLMGLKKCSLLEDTELEVTYHPYMHDLSNEWRLAHMPPVAS